MGAGKWEIVQCFRAWIKYVSCPAHKRSYNSQGGKRKKRSTKILDFALDIDIFRKISIKVRSRSNLMAER